MSIEERVEQDRCHGCGKLWSEVSPDCVFNYHADPTEPAPDRSPEQFVSCPGNLKAEALEAVISRLAPDLDEWLTEILGFAYDREARPTPEDLILTMARHLMEPAYQAGYVRALADAEERIADIHFDPNPGYEAHGEGFEAMKDEALSTLAALKEGKQA